MLSMLHILPLRNAFSALIVTLLLMLPTLAYAKEGSAFELTKELKAEGFSGTVRVAYHGRVTYQRSFGLADRTFAVPIDSRTRFHIASITKLFTSVLVLRLVEQGKVELDAPFQRYLPGYPGQGAEQVTVRQLLGHMSGLPQFDTVTSFDAAIAEGLPNYQQWRSPKQLLQICCSNGLAARPGERFDYNNADYIVLGHLIEAVTGLSYAEALDQQILRPADLRNTAMAQWSQPTPWLARTYFRRPGGTVFENELPFFWENSYAAGGLYSSVDDIARFSDAVFAGRLLSPDSLAQLLKPAGDEYGLGLWSYSFVRRGIRYGVAKRPGSIMGANTMLYRLPDEGLSIVILANSNAVDLDILAQRLAEAALDGKKIL
mgnify:FL=1